MSTGYHTTAAENLDYFTLKYIHIYIYIIYNIYAKHDTKFSKPWTGLAQAFNLKLSSFAGLQGRSLEEPSADDQNA